MARAAAFAPLDACRPAALAAAAARAFAVTGLACALAAAIPAAPGARDTDHVPVAAVVASVAGWTAEAARLPLPEALPEVSRASRRQMAELLYGAEAAARGAVVPVEALYDRSRERILLAEDWTGASPRALSVLVHELVHHFEAAAGVVPACPAAGEARAYGVQEAWLAGFGSGLHLAFGIDPVTLRLLTRCPGFGGAAEVIRVRGPRRSSAPFPGSPTSPQSQPG